MYVCVRLCMYIYIYIHYTNNISNNHVCIYSYCTYTSYNHILCFFSYLLEASLYETNDLGVARDLWFMARDSPPLTQAVPSGGRSFLIETATVLVCMSWPYGEFRNGQRSLKKLEFPRQKRQWLRTWKCEYIYIYIGPNSTFWGCCLPPLCMSQRLCAVELSVQYSFKEASGSFLHALNIFRHPC